MEKKAIIQYKKRFDDIRHEENGIEFWYARELMELLEYAQWRNFEKTIEKAKTSCENNGITVTDHFADVSKMVKIGSKAQRKLDDYMEIPVRNRSHSRRVILRCKQESRNLLKNELHI